jgi:hypothetical protein
MWHARPATTHELRRHVYSKPCVSIQPTSKQAALAERFRLIAAANPHGLSSPSIAVAQPLIQLHSQTIQGSSTAAAWAPDVSLGDSFYSVILQNKSIIDSDFKDMGSLVDLSHTPLIPAAYTDTNPAEIFANHAKIVQGARYIHPPPPLPNSHGSGILRGAYEKVIISVR